MVLLILSASCSTWKEVSIDTSLSDAELIQRGQEAFDVNRYKQAIEYYTVVLERAGPYSESFFAAKYEIAFVHYKMKDYKSAQSELTAILSSYENSDSELYPAQYRILSKIILDSIGEKSP